jgi:hypothetical protein
MRALPDLWERLARLDQCCRVRMISRFDKRANRVGWQILIERRDGRGPSIRIEGLGLAEALYDATIRAEAQGWRG